MDDAAARALAQSILTPGETLLWAQTAPAWTIASPAIFGVIVCAVILYVSKYMRQPEERGPAMRRAVSVVMVLWYAMFSAGLAFGVFQASSAWSTAYAVTDKRVVIVSHFPWQWTREFGPEVFDRYGIQDDTLAFDWGGSVKRCCSYRARLEGLEQPEQVAALVKKHIAPHAVRNDTMSD
jgi:hypothetical protein